jgi:hypothetical protein
MATASFQNAAGDVSVKLTPAGTVPVAAGVTDSTGAAFDPGACAHAFAYTNGLLTTDTATDGTSTWIKTYAYTAGALTSETKWVKQ